MARIALTFGKNGNLRGLRLCALLLPVLAIFCVADNNPILAENHKLYVTHSQYYQNGKSAVSVINLDSLIKVTQIYPAAGTEKALYCSQTGRLYFFSSLNEAGEVYDPVTDEKLFGFKTGGPVADVIFSHDGKWMFIANGGPLEGAANSVTIVESETGTVIFTIKVGGSPNALELSADGKLLYVADRARGIVHVVELANFQVLRSFYGGVRPCDLELSWYGKMMLVASQNLRIDEEKQEGAGLALIDLEKESVAGLINTEGDINSILIPDKERIICLENQRYGDMLNIFSYIHKDNGVSIKPLQNIRLDAHASGLRLVDEGRLLLVAGKDDGIIKVLDLETYQIKHEISDLFHENLSGMVSVPMDFAVQVAIRDSIIRSDPTGTASQDAYFEKAYLYRCMGDKNSEVKIYNEMAANYSGTETEVLSFLRLGDLCYNDLLYANSADFYSKAFKAYAAFLEKSDGSQLIDDNIIFAAIERLGELSLKGDENYLEEIVASMEKLTVSANQLAELNFLLAYYLKRQGDTRLARRCLDETERQMIHFTDQNLYKRLRDKIDLLNNEGRIVLTASKIKSGPLIDGDPSEWKEKNSLILDRRSDMLVNSQRWINENDLALEMRAAYDNQNLYLLGIVIDNKLFSYDDLKQDKLVLYIDSREKSGQFVQRTSELDGNVFRMQIIPPAESDQDFKMNHSPAFQPIFAGKTTSSGYVFEIKIPLVYLQGIGPDGINKCGFGLELWDADSDLPADPLKIMGWVAPTQSVDGDRDSRMFGILEF